MEGQNDVRNMVHGNGIVIGHTNATGCDELEFLKKEILMYHKYSILKLLW
jgi:hypothetical protein